MISRAATTVPFSAPKLLVAPAAISCASARRALGSASRLPSECMTGWHLMWARLRLTAALSPSALAGGGDYDVLAWAAPAAAALAVAALAVAALMPSELNRAVLDTCCSV